MSALYATKATAIGGRNGSVRTDDGQIDLKLALPSALGGKGGAANPEQLFAAGYAACFGNAVIHAAHNTDKKIRDNDVEVTATVGIEPNGAGGFALTVALDVMLAGIDQASAETIVAAAHKVCPYSNAVRGNIDVALSVHAH